MRAVVLREPGPADHLKLESLPDPTPGAGEAVVRLRAAALNHRDVWIRSGTGAYAAGFARPVILGSGGAGEVTAVGDGVDRALVERAVVINPSLDWGDDDLAQCSGFRILGLPDDGTYAEDIRIPARNVLPKPARLSFEEAATLPHSAILAIQGLRLRDGRTIKAGDRVLVDGASGNVGPFAVQVAKARGAEVTGMDRETEAAVLRAWHDQSTT